MPTRAMPPAQPLLIDAASHTCVGWWHAPAPAPDASQAPALPRGWLPAGALPLAVVLAGSWGEEDIAAYDGLRALAVALAAAGLGVLRFEWPDTGDSSAASGTTSPADALAAFEAAASQARALSGCDRLAFVGLRLGALLAAQAAQVRDDVAALVGLLPVASGRAFAREQRQLEAGLAAAVPAPRPGAAFDPADLPVALGGFALTVRRLEAMAALKWPGEPFPSLREALLLGLPGQRAHAAFDALAAAGVRVSAWSHDGLAGVLDAAQPAGFEPEAIAEIVRWLQARADDVAATVPATERLEAATGAVLALSAAGARPWLRVRANGVAVRERVVRLGDPRDREPPSLCGVLSETDPPTARSTVRTPRRGIVLVSAGRERRIGPHRLWVPWARERAARGDVVLRLDMPGIGDSEGYAPAGELHPPGHDEARGIDAIARAAAWLRREHGVGAVTLMGLGAGAWQAWQAALAGIDVQQVVAVSLPMFHWRPGIALDAVGPARRARDALRRCARAVARLLRVPLAHDLAADLLLVAARGIALDVVFARRDPGLAAWRQEAGRRGARLARDRRVGVRGVEHADRTFAGTAGRAALLACLDTLLPTASPLTFATPAARPRQPEVARP